MTAHALSIQLIEAERKIVLAGTLDHSDGTWNECASKLQNASSISQWHIDASQVLLPSGGAKTWILATREFLDSCQLVYLPSQLSRVLQLLDDEYQHPDSKFVPTEANMKQPRMSPRSMVPD